MAGEAAPAAPDPGREAARRRLEPSERMPQILEAALAEFAERGFAGARMAAVATRAGIAKGLIYHYFPSKAELFEATVRDCTRPVFEAAERRLSGFRGSARRLLADLLDVAYARIREEPRERVLFRLIVSESARVPELAEFYRREILARATGIARAVLRAGVASGEFRPEVAEAPCYAEVIMAPAIMASVWRTILDEAAAPDLEGMRAAHLDLLLAGLERRGEGDGRGGRTCTAGPGSPTA
jgi:AcrR family transcriptional regulator